MADQFYVSPNGEIMRDNPGGPDAKVRQPLSKLVLTDAERTAILARVSTDPVREALESFEAGNGPGKPGGEVTADAVADAVEAADAATLARIQSSVSGDEAARLDAIAAQMPAVSTTRWGTVAAPVSGPATYAGMPSSCVLGGVIYTAYRLGLSHYPQDTPSRIYVSSSRDGGQNWSTGIAIGSAPMGTDPLIDAVGSRLYCYYKCETGVFPSSGTWMQHSDDLGATWTAPVKIISWAYGVSRAVRTASGKWRMLCYRQPTASTWRSELYESATSDPYSAYTLSGTPFAVSGKDVTEWTYCQLPGTGTLLAVGRNETDFTTLAATSSDDGATWAAPAVIMSGSENFDGWPTVGVTSLGIVYLIGRRNSQLLDVAFLTNTAAPTTAASWVRQGWVSKLLGQLGTPGIGCGCAKPIYYGGVLCTSFYEEVSSAGQGAAGVARVKFAVVDLDRMAQFGYSENLAYETITGPGPGLYSLTPTPDTVVVWSPGAVFGVDWSMIDYFGSGQTQYPYRITLRIDDTDYSTFQNPFGMWIDSAQSPSQNVGYPHGRTGGTRYLSRGWHTISLIYGVDNAAGQRLFGARVLRVRPVI